ncbi:MAG: DNA alkylation repair protein [Planctomycetaceae bacterium]
MELSDVLSKLKMLGTEQAIKIYKRHGAGDNVFGVSFADLKKLKKQIGTNHSLAIGLWNSGNSDARSLAMMIADPQKVSPTVATQWMKDVSYYLHAGEVAGVVAKSPCGPAKMRQWRKQKSEFARSTGYSILSHMLKDDPESVDESECRRVLKEIESEIHRSANRARHAMVMAVISIGVYKPELCAEAIEAGERIGDVDVDHGETSCTTPKIAAYIQKSVRRATGKAPRIRSC